MLTATLKDQHAAIKKLLDEVRVAGITSEVGKKKLSQVKQLIVAHLKKEDAELYPGLKAKAATTALAETYTREMGEITTNVIGFFNKYETNTDGMEFARDLGRVMATLSARMTREEIRLYPAYDEHCR